MSPRLQRTHTLVLNRLWREQQKERRAKLAAKPVEIVQPKEDK